MHSEAEISGTAALAICESLLLCLTDGNIITEREAKGLLQDAANAHLHAGQQSKDGNLHKSVAELITAIIAGRNSTHLR